MKRKIDPVAIGSVAVDISKNIDQLMIAVDTLTNDIQKIREYYQGVDAELIISKYLEKINVINTIISNYNDIKKYFVSISTNYSNNLNEAKMSLNQILVNQSEDKKLINQTLSLKKIK